MQYRLPLERALEISQVALPQIISQLYELQRSLNRLDFYRTLSYIEPYSRDSFLNG